MRDICIKDIKAREVIDSRGNPTVKVEVILNDSSVGKSIVPSGASTGSHEALELRDNDTSRYLGKGVLKAVENVNKIIRNELIEKSPFNQRKIDEMLVNLDGTKDKSRLGANAILATSLALAKASAKSLNIPLYRYIGGINANILPVPMMNILNGGKHSSSNVSIQEFMIVPVGGCNFNEKLRMCIEVYHYLKNTLKQKGYLTGVGDEGGFAPNLQNEEQAIEYIIEAIQKSGYNTQNDFNLALDVAASEMYNEAIKIGEKGKYYFWKTNILKTRDEIIEYYQKLANKYPICSIEDGLFEDDFEGWKILNERLGNKIQIVGDDLFVTNYDRLKYGIENNVANCILIKPNQIGTLTETLNTIKLAQKAGYRTIISHRSGETEDTTIADLAVGVNAGQIKTGAPCRSERVAKYNRLLEIEEKI